MTCCTAVRAGHIKHVAANHGSSTKLSDPGPCWGLQGYHCYHYDYCCNDLYCCYYCYYYYFYSNYFYCRNFHVGRLQCGQTASASKQRRPNPTLSSVSSCALQRLRAAQHFPQIRVLGFWVLRSRVLGSRNLGF